MLSIHELQYEDGVLRQFCKVARYIEEFINCRSRVYQNFKIDHELTLNNRTGAKRGFKE